MVIAALNGNTVGGGLEIAMAADLRLARKNGGKVGLPEVTLGVLPGTGGTQRLVRIVGKSRAIELMVTGRLFSFEDALGYGIIDSIIEGDDFMGQVHEYARQFCPPNKAAKAVGRIKRAVHAALDLPLDQGLALERELAAELFASEDAKEGLAAHSSKRQAVFRAR